MTDSKELRGEAFSKWSYKIWHPTMKLKNLLDNPQKKLLNKKSSYLLPSLQLTDARKAHMIAFKPEKTLATGSSTVAESLDND